MYAAFRGTGALSRHSEKPNSVYAPMARIMAVVSRIKSGERRQTSERPDSACWPMEVNMFSLQGTILRLPEKTVQEFNHAVIYIHQPSRIGCRLLLRLGVLFESRVATWTLRIILYSSV